MVKRTALTAVVLCSFTLHAQPQNNNDTQQLTAWLTGDFTNFQYLLEEPGSSAPLLYRIRPVSVAELKGPVLLSQQSTLHAPADILREQVFSFSYDAKRDIMVQTLYHLSGSSTDGAAITPEQLIELDGCEVHWRFETDRFVGSRNKNTCFFYDSESGEAISFKGELELSAYQFSAVDQAYLSDGTPLAGDDYVSTVVANRVQYFDADVHYLPVGNDENGWRPASISSDIHDQGQRIGLSDQASGLELSYQFLLLRTASEPQVRRLQVFRGNQTEAIREWSVPADQLHIEVKMDQLHIRLKARGY